VGGGCSGQRHRDLLVVEQRRRARHEVADVVQAGRLGEHVADRRLALSRGGELGPVIGNRIVDGEEPPLDQQVQGGRRHPFGGRPRHGNGVVRPGCADRSVSCTRPRVDHQRAAVHDGERAPASASQRPGQHLCHRSEVGVHLRFCAIHLAIVISR
jgi:hypothetical protein